jgi:hypothetical protein
MTPVAWSWDNPAEMINVWITPERLNQDLIEEGDGDRGRIELMDRFCIDDPLLAQLGSRSGPRAASRAPSAA